MKFKGTKKEWISDIPTSTRLDGVLTNACDVANDQGDYVATVYGRTPKICKANSILISQSPKLLETLQTVKSILESPKLIDAGNLRRLINNTLDNVESV